MNKNFLITVSAVLLIGVFICACSSRSAKVEESIQAVVENIQVNENDLYSLIDTTSQEYIETQNLNENEQDTYYLKKIIANFYKYKDEERLFEGIKLYGSFNMQFSDTLLIFNFEKGTVKKVKRENDKDVNYFNYIKGFPTKKTVTGDFNGDGRKETLKVENLESLFQYDSAELKREINGSRFIYFPKDFDSFYFTSSDKKIPNLEVWGNYDFTIKNLGDLDGDGGDEIGFLYGKSTSNCHFYNVFTLKNNKWELLVENIPLTYDMRSTGIIPVEKDPKNKGVILIRYDSDCGSCYSASYVIEESFKVK